MEHATPLVAWWALTGSKTPRKACVRVSAVVRAVRFSIGSRAFDLVLAQDSFEVFR